ncbi:MAG: hypothetical protein KKB30_08565 [Proteobacteria bacterium]|nr:hypothetical protein [Pseudomonadota bacterium]MBU1716926.1 hypothetical protein [Pseudomonadota bacterium]
MFDLKGGPAIKIILILIIYAFISGCSSDDSDSSASISPLDREGIFIDSPLMNVEYSSSSHEGRTNVNGAFLYRIGEKVTFSIGDIVLGSALGQEVVSPFELTPGADSVAHPSIINLIRFLQSLDSDGDVTNGISITNEMHTLANGVLINFHQLADEFSEDPAVVEYIADSTASNLLLDATTATGNFTTVIDEYRLVPLAASKNQYKVVRNLDPRLEVPFTANNGKAFSSADTLSYNYTDSFLLNDSFGFPHTVNMYWVKEPLDLTDPLTEGLPNSWSLYVEVDEGQKVGGTDIDDPTDARFILRFDTDGNLATAETLVVSNWTPLYSADDSSRPLGPDVDHEVVNDPPTSSNFMIDVADVRFGESVE